MTTSAFTHSPSSVRRSCAVLIVSLSLFMSGGPGRAQEDSGATDAARQNLESIVEDWTALQKSFKESDSLDATIGNFERGLTSRAESITRLPDTNPKKAEMLAALQKIQTEFPVQAKAAQGALEARHLRESWDLDSSEGFGWEQETPATFTALLKQQSEAMSSLGMPKTVKWHQTAMQFLKNAKPQTDDTAVKGLLTNIGKSRDIARGRLVKAAEGILDEAGKAKLTPESRNRLDTFGADDLRLALGEAPETAPLQARAAALVAAFDKAAGGSKADVEKLASDLNEQAAKAWPKLADSVKTSADFDAAAALKNPDTFKGRLFLLSSVSNRMGWDFKPGDYQFAMQQRGIAVVGIYDAAVKAVVEDTKKRLGLDDLPEENYDLIVEVSGTAKATVFQDVAGEVKVDGTSDTLKVSGRKEVKEDAVLLHIIGLHVGPVAVVAGAGSVQADGSLAPAGAPTALTIGSSGSGGLLERSFWCLLGLAAGFLALVHARFPALVKLGPVQKAQPFLTKNVLTGAGLFFIAAGLVLLVRGMFIHGLLMSLIFLLTGLFLSLDFFTARKWLPEHLAVKVRSQGGVIGLAAAGIAVLFLVIAGRFVVI